ncbi:formylglycine-generating enzyme family protein [Nocardia sp. NPDC051832]|uniref:formylglycine-generating enzyme family protein n=1 Tax=Nocardia sp. NPDC051832 TaxID=3155673 RepID=UPI0034432570
MNADIEMAALSGGEATLTDRRTQRSWSVEVKPFALAAFLTTQQQYAELTSEHPSAAVGERLPVESVSWADAVRFCNALSDRAGLKPVYLLLDDDVQWDSTADGYRLPTEAEWEYACRAGSTGPRYGELDEIGWYRGNSSGHPHEVGGKLPNSWGLYDMLGNVWEWCWDYYDTEVYGSYRVLRGGGWFDEHWSCRASVRRRSHPSLRIEDTGFRVARSL